MTVIEYSKPCVICTNEKYKSTFHSNDKGVLESEFKLISCCNCGMTITYPVLDEDGLSKYYQAEYYGGGKRKFTVFVEKLVLIFNKYRACKIVRFIKKFRSEVGREQNIHVLDVGCGRALLLKEINKLGCKCYGLERRDYRDDEIEAGITYFYQSIEDSSFQPETFDSIIFWHVLEHLRDPAKALKEATRLLKTEGILVISVPNFDSYQLKLFETYWFHLDVPRHLHHFSVRTLKKLLLREKLELISESTFSLEQNPYGFIQSFMDKFIYHTERNNMYALLKNNYGWKRKVILCGWLVTTLFILPFALIEFLASGLLGKGATVTLYLRKISE